MKRTLAMLLAVAAAVVFTLPTVLADQSDQADVQLKAAIKKEVVDGDLKAAIELYRRIAQGSDRAVAARALIRMGQCHEKLGDAESTKAYRRVVSEFADQKDAVNEARALLAAGTRDRRSASGVSEQQVWVLSEIPTPYPRHPSLDGRYITYSDIGGNRVKLYDLSSAGSRTLVERERGFSVGAPVMSPDGRRIAYTRCVGFPMRCSDFELRIANLDGSQMKVLAANKQWEVGPVAWSPDGSQILARRRDDAAGYSMLLISVADGSTRALPTKGDISNGCFSPDGKHVVTYPATPQGAGAAQAPGGLKLQPVDGSAAIPLFESPARNWAPFWAPDGRHLVFLSDRTGTTDLWMMRMNGARPEGEAELVRSNVERMNPLGFTRDGSFYYRLDVPYLQDVYIADLDPATGRALSKPERANQRSVGKSGLGVAWSPDGQLLAYTKESGTTTTSIVLRSDRTGEERELIPAPSFQRNAGIVDMVWFPDGRALLAHVQDSNRRSMFQQIDVQTGQVKTLVDLRASNEGVSYPALSPDGQTVFYVQSGAREQDTRTIRLMRRNLETGETKELHQSTRYLESLSVSADGRELLFQGSYPDLNTMSLLAIPTEGGAIREVYRSKDYISDNIWWSNSRRVLFSISSKADQQPLLSVPIEGGEPQPTGITMPIMYTLALRPDGRRVAFVNGEGAPDEVWVIRNLLSAANAPRK